MAKYELTNKAVEDLVGIWEYSVEKWSEEQADKYYSSIKSACNEIGKNTGSINNRVCSSIGSIGGFVYISCG
jgi:plasmid stabilization system protein ParE